MDRKTLEPYFKGSASVISNSNNDQKKTDKATSSYVNIPDSCNDSNPAEFGGQTFDHDQNKSLNKEPLDDLKLDANLQPDSSPPILEQQRYTQ